MLDDAPSHRHLTHLAPVAFCAAALPLLLAGCASEDLPEVTVTPGSSAVDKADESVHARETVTEFEEAESEPDYTLVNPAPFLSPDGQVAIIDTKLSGTNHHCALNDLVLACSATPPDDVPNLENMPGKPWGPFTGRPSSVYIDENGLRWGVLEGGPPGSSALRPGERLEFGIGWCQVPDNNSIQCGANGESFTITGAGRTFSQP